MRKLTVLVIGLAAISCCVSVATAQDALSEQKKAQIKLMSYRAARADAIRKIAERVKALKISSATTVKDSVAESDEIRTALDAYLTGAQETARPRYTEDGVCSVTMKVTLEEVITDLQKIHTACYKGKKFKVEDFEKITTNVNFKEIEETGSGAPKTDIQVTETVAVKDGQAEQASYPASAKGYWSERVTPQGRLMAIRAARLDAYRRLSERIKGTKVQSETSVKDFVAEDDFIRLASENHLKGVKEVGVRFHPDELVVEVEMQVKLRTVMESVKTFVEEKYKDDKAKIKKFEEITQTYQDTIIRETGMGIPPAKYLKNADKKEVAVMEMTKQFSKDMPQWADQILRVRGQGLVGKDGDEKQNQLMAYRAAELDARRKIAEEIDGLELVANKTKVRDFAKCDEIRTSVVAFQQGAAVIEESKQIKDGVATVEVEIDLRPLWDMYISNLKKNAATGESGKIEIKTRENN